MADPRPLDEHHVGITLRSLKGESLTHHEVDDNFRQFIHSGSIINENDVLKLYTSHSVGAHFEVPINITKGEQYSIQFKSGSFASGSNKFLYNYDADLVTLDGDITITGNLTANEYHTNIVSASIIYQSGSTKFGDTADDNHNFTGSLNLLGDQVTTGNIEGNSNLSIAGRAVIEGDITGNSNLEIAQNINGNGDLNIAGTAVIEGDVFGNSNLEIAQNIQAGNNLIVANDANIGGTVTATTLKLTGNATIDGNIVLGGNINIGDASTDSITLGGELTSNIIPDITDTYNLGSAAKVWKEVHATSVNTQTLSTNDAAIGELLITDHSITAPTELIIRPGLIVEGPALVDTLNVTGHTELDTLAVARTITADEVTASLFIGDLKGTASTASYVDYANVDNKPFISDETVTVDTIQGITGANTFTLNSNTPVALEFGLDFTDPDFQEGVKAIKSDEAIIADTASYISGARVDGTVATATSASYALTASYVENVPAGYGDAEVQDLLDGRLESNIIPNGNEVYDLGSPENKFRHLYLSSNTLYVGESEVTVRENELLVNGEPVRTEQTDISINDFTFQKNVTVNGTLTATNFHTINVSSSVIYQEGSTSFGDSEDDLHTFTGRTRGIRYGDLEELPFIPQDVTDLTDTTGLLCTIEGIITSSEAHFSGDYNDLTNTPFIPIVPTTLSSFENDLEEASPRSGTFTVTGDLVATGDIKAFASSDRRLKDNIKPIESSLEKIKAIGGYEFDWNSLSNNEGHDIGVIAQEVETVLPEVVTTRDDGFKAVRYEKIVALLIEAIKDQQSQIDELKARL